MTPHLIFLFDFIFFYSLWSLLTLQPFDWFTSFTGITACEDLTSNVMESSLLHQLPMISMYLPTYLYYVFFSSFFVSVLVVKLSPASVLVSNIIHYMYKNLLVVDPYLWINWGRTTVQPISVLKQSNDRIAEWNVLLSEQLQANET